MNAAHNPSSHRNTLYTITVNTAGQAKTVCGSVSCDGCSQLTGYYFIDCMCSLSDMSDNSWGVLTTFLPVTASAVSALLDHFFSDVAV